ncbi:MAG: oligosaccharide flippase family protein [Candidatus Helarchaeota archaeon]
MNIGNSINLKSLLFENKTIKQTIFKNTFWLGLTGVIQKGVSFLVIVWLARYFGPVIYGKWAFALSFTALFAFLPNFGFGLLTIRELARDKFKNK